MEFDPSELDDLIERILAADQTVDNTGDLGREHAASRLIVVAAHLDSGFLFGITADEIDVLAVQQSQWEATAHVEAGEILQRAHAQAQQSSDLGGYHGRHHAYSGAPLGPATAFAYTSESPTHRPMGLPKHVHDRLPDVRGKGNFKVVPRSGSASALRGTPADPIDRIRPKMWSNVYQWISEELGGDRITIYQLVDQTFLCAKEHRPADLDPDNAFEVRDWVRQAMMLVLHFRSRREQYEAGEGKGYHLAS